MKKKLVLDEEENLFEISGKTGAGGLAGFIIGAGDLNALQPGYIPNFDYLWPGSGDEGDFDETITSRVHLEIEVDLPKGTARTYAALFIVRPPHTPFGDSQNLLTDKKSWGLVRYIWLSLNADPPVVDEEDSPQMYSPNIGETDLSSIMSLIREKVILNP